MDFLKLAFEFFLYLGLNLLVLGIKIEFKVAATKSNHCCSRARRLLQVDPVLVLLCLCLGLCSFEGWKALVFVFVFLWGVVGSCVCVCVPFQEAWQAGGREVVKSAAIEHLSLCWCQRE